MEGECVMGKRMKWKEREQTGNEKKSTEDAKWEGGEMEGIKEGKIHKRSEEKERT